MKTSLRANKKYCREKKKISKKIEVKNYEAFLLAVNAQSTVPC